MRYVRSILPLVAVLALTACTVVPGANTPAPEQYSLSPDLVGLPQSLPEVDWQLAVETPDADAGLNTRRIALRQDVNRLDYYERANWVDTAPRMLQSLIVEGFEQSGRIPAVAKSSVAIRSDFALHTEIREFQVVFNDGRPQADVRLTAKLIQMPQRTVLGSTTVEHRAPARSDALNDVVMAFNSAVSATVEDLVQWTLETATTAPRKKPT
jgi:cholesterol transport system auxiliary component